MQALKVIGMVLTMIMVLGFSIYGVEVSTAPEYLKYPLMATMVLLVFLVLFFEFEHNQIPSKDNLRASSGSAVILSIFTSLGLFDAFCREFGFEQQMNNNAVVMTIGALCTILFYMVRENKLEITTNGK